VGRRYRDAPRFNARWQSEGRICGRTDKARPGPGLPRLALDHSRCWAPKASPPRLEVGVRPSAGVRHRPRHRAHPARLRQQRQTRGGQQRRPARQLPAGSVVRSTPTVRRRGSRPALKDLGGKPFAVDSGFTALPRRSAPTTLSRLARLRGKLAAATGSKFAILFVSVDPGTTSLRPWANTSSCSARRSSA